VAGERILFVDDEEQIRKLLTAYLRRRGYLVTTVGDGHAALMTARTERPGLIITDVNMPCLDGLELTREVRADLELADIPIIILSAQRQAEDVQAGRAAGADEYVAKPVDMARLAQTIEHLLRARHRPN
jgi:CheY-like chemotaxis protein